MEIWIPTIVSILALVAAVIFGIVNARQAADSAEQARRSAVSSEKSLDLAQKELESSSAAQAESLSLAREQLANSMAANAANQKLATQQIESSRAAQAESLRLAQIQLENSVKAHQDSTQPYVWADLRPREDGSGLMLFIVGNSGPTTATDVRIEFQPAFNYVVPTDRVKDAHHVEETLTKGLSSLPPGKVIGWSVGLSWDFFGEKKGPESSFEITIRAMGPHGELEPLVYGISLDSMKEQALRPVGLGLVEKPLNAVEKRLEAISKTLDKIHEQRPQQPPPVV